jgi:hypothetical protein
MLTQALKLPKKKEKKVVIKPVSLVRPDLEDFRNRRIVLIGKPPGGWRVQKFADFFRPVEAIVNPTFTKKTTLAFYNPKVGGAKIKRVRELGIQAFSYRDIIKAIGKMSSQQVQVM